MFRHHGAPAQLVLDAQAQLVRGCQFAMHDVNLIGRLGHGFQPRQKLSGIGVRRGRLQLHDFGAQFDVASVDTVPTSY